MVKPSVGVRSPILDQQGNRIVTYFDPVKDAEKLQSRLGIFRGSGGYTGARTDRSALEKWDPRVDSADSSSLPALPRLRARSRDLVRNTPTAAAAINSVVTNAIGTGLTPVPAPDADYLGLSKEEVAAWTEQVERIWWAWAGSKACDIRRILRFSTMQSLALRSQLESGDVLAIRRYRPARGDLLGLKIQFVEADRISTPPEKLADPNIVEGVEFDPATGEEVAFWVQDQHPGDNLMGRRTSLAKWTRVAARGAKTGQPVAIHLFDPLRFGQTRGVPMLAAVIEHLKQLGRYSDSELMAAVLGGMIVYSLETPDGESAPQFADVGEQDGPSDSSGKLEIDYGALLGLAKGEKLEMHSPGRPNAGYQHFVKAMQREVGAAIGVPAEVMLLEFNKSYSASRAAWMLAWKHYEMRRHAIAWDFSHVAYSWVVEESIARGLLSAPGFNDDPLARAAWLGGAWRGAPAGQLDPLKEIQAVERRRALRISTLAQDTAEITGGDWRENLRQAAIEQDLEEELELRPAPVPAPIRSNRSGREDPDDVDDEEEEGDT